MSRSGAGVLGAPRVGSSRGLHLQQQLNDVHVHQPQDGLAVDVGDEVPSSQARLLGGASLLHVLGVRVDGSVSGLGPRGWRPHAT